MGKQGLRQACVGMKVHMPTHVLTALQLWQFQKFPFDLSNYLLVFLGIRLCKGLDMQMIERIYPDNSDIKVKYLHQDVM